MPDQILIRGLQLSCRIGVPKEEREFRQTLRAHLTLTVVDFPDNDALAGTVDYAEVSERVRDLAGVGERLLIETLAQEIADLILNQFPVLKVRVELEKFILPETDWVGVAIEREAEKSDKI